MFHYSRHSKTKMLLWGMVAGLFTGLYVAMKYMRQPISIPSGEAKEEKHYNKVPSESHLQQEKENNEMKLDEQTMQQIFNTFLNGTEEEIKGVANDITKN